MVSDDMPLQSKNVCVIGAGMSGLAAARELLREGHAVSVLEQYGDVGGQWLYDPRTDDADGPLDAAPPVKVHSSMYASARLLVPRDNMGFSDFPFAPSAGDGRDARRFPRIREMYCYLKDFCDAFGLMDAVRLNTRVVRAALSEGDDAGGFSGVAKWLVRSVRVEPESGEEVAVEEVFDAVVVANGCYSQPSFPTIDGIGAWRRRQLHGHSYRVPEQVRGEVVVLVGCGDSGLDVALDIVGVAKEVHLAAKSVEAVTTPAVSKMLRRHANMHLHPQVRRLLEDGLVVFADGAGVVADTIIYCTGYIYSFPFLETGGLLTVDDNRVGPLFEHVFPPALAPSLSFMGIPRKVFVPWLLEAQGRWIARVLSGRSALPPVEEMLRAVEEYCSAREAAGVPRKHTHNIGGVDANEMHEFAAKYTPDMPRIAEWNMELADAAVRNLNENRETFRDLDYGTSDAPSLAAQQ